MAKSMRDYDQMTLEELEMANQSLWNERQRLKAEQERLRPYLEAAQAAAAASAAAAADPRLNQSVGLGTPKPSEFK